MQVFQTLYSTFMKGLPQSFHQYNKLKKANSEAITYLETVEITYATGIKEEYRYHNLMLLPLLRIYYYDRMFMV